MGKSQEFKATVNFGAVIDPGFGAAVSAVGETFTEAARDAAAEVNKLTKEQVKLTREIKKGVLAGKDVGELKRQYGELSDSIEKASRKLSRLNAVGKAGRMAANTGRAGLAVARPVAGAVAVGGGVMVAGIAGAIAANAETAMQLGKAQGYGLDFGTHMAYQGIGKAIGVDEDAVGDLLDEMKNKIGEAGNENMLNPLLAQIGMSKTSAQKMMKQDPDKLFNAVMSRLTAQVKSGRMSAGEAGSFADQLFGGEAQKVVSYMTTLGKTFEELTAAGKKYNLVTEEGAREAVKGQYALNSLWGVVTSGVQEMVGRTLGAAGTDILAGADTLKAGLEAKIPEITRTVTDWFTADEDGQTGPQRLWETVTDVAGSLEKFGRVVMVVADKLDWLLPDDELVSQQKQQLIKMLETGNTSPALVASHAEELGLKDWFEDWRDQRSRAYVPDRYTLEGDSGSVRVYEHAIPVPDYSPQVNNTTTTNTLAPVFNIQTQPGQSGEDIAREINTTLHDLTLTGSPAWDRY